MRFLKLALAVALAVQAAPVAQARAQPPPSPASSAPPRADASDEAIVAAYFAPAEVERGCALGNHRALCWLADQALVLLALGLLAFAPAGRRAAERLRARVGSLRLRTGLAAECVLVGAALALAQLPMAYYRGFVLEHQLGLSTQSAGSWLGDQALEAALGLAILVVAVQVAHALQLWSPRRWWLWSWAALTAGIFVFFFLHPVLIAPLFNSYRPLAPGPLRDGCTRIAREAGIPVSEVFVVDASRRTKRYNAFFTGVGATRTIALHDTLVDGMTTPETLAVVGHEAGHWVHQHLMRGLAIASACIFGFLALAARPALLGTWPLARPGALARAAFLVLACELAFVPVESTLSRAMEAQADAAGLTLSRDPDATVRMLVALARSNVSNLLPHPLLRAALYTHPPIPERIRMALAAREATSPAAPRR